MDAAGAATATAVTNAARGQDDSDSGGGSSAPPVDNAALPLTAATGALGPAIAKLTALQRDAGGRSRSDAGELLVASELKRLHSLLLRVWERGVDGGVGAACKEWTAAALELSYRAEDAADSFRHGGSADAAASPVEELRQQAQRLLGQFREEWTAATTRTTHVPDDGGLGEPSSCRPRRDAMATELEEAEEKKAELMRLLREQEVVCVHGAPGAGKTTLADLVYQEGQGEQFQCRAFVSVSPKPSMMQTVLSNIVVQVIASAITKAAASAKREETNSATLAYRNENVDEKDILDSLSELLKDLSEVTGGASPPAKDTKIDPAPLDATGTQVANKKGLIDKDAKTGSAALAGGNGGTAGANASGSTTPTGTGIPVAQVDLIDKISQVLVQESSLVAGTGVTDEQYLINIMSKLLGEKKRQVTQSEEVYKQYLISIISRFLSDKRYLVIVDDIWHWEQWEDIRKSLPENSLGSRIIMTTRVTAVAEKCHTDYCLYKIVGLSMDAAAALSSRRIFSEAHIISSGMHPTCTSIAKMSAGIPLAIICMSEAVAKQLAPKEGQVHYSDVSARNQFDVALRQALDGFLDSPSMKPLAESIGLSYHLLPLHLKTCLLQCSIYPPNESFERDDLIRIWIAEGFVYEEEQAQSYFDELVQWGCIFPVESRGITKAPEYGINTMMLAFLRCQRQEYNFVSSVGYFSDIGSLYGRRIRRLSVQGSLSSWDVSILDFSSIRSLHVFGRASLVPFERLTLLRVLHLDEDCNSEDADLYNYPDLGDDDLVEICELLFLRYIRLKGCKITKIPPEIKRLQHLETLDLRSTGVRELPKEIGEVELLKHLNISGTAVTNVPREIGRLKHLKTLDVSSTSVTGLPDEIRGLEHLEKLDVSNTMVAELPNEIGLKQMKTLDVSGTNVTELPKDIGQLQHLETLDVSNTKISELPKEIWKLRKLKTLNISSTKFRELPWEAGQHSNSISVLAGDNGSPVVTKLPEGSCEYGEVCSRHNICINLFDRFGSTWQPVPVARFKIPGKHVNIPSWIEKQLSNIPSLEISLWELRDNDLKILQEMPNLQALALRVDVLRRTAITGAGFSRLESFCLDCRVPRITFKNEAMPVLKHLEFKFYAFRATEKEDPMGITHLRSLRRIVFRSASGYKSNDPGISAVINKVREEAKAHRNRITLCINDQEEVVQEKCTNLSSAQRQCHG
ncbi:hypothetical protein ACP4OV_002202 [Aristida adscensionis]